MEALLPAFSAYPSLVLSDGRGASVRLYWAEALFESLTPAPGAWFPAKGNRGVVEGRHFLGVGDTFIHDGKPDRR